MKVGKKTQSLVLAVALTQCYAFTGCASRAMLESTKKANQNAAKKLGLANTPVQAAAPAATPTPGATSAAEAASPSSPASSTATFASSLASVDLDIKEGSASLKFAHWQTPDQYASIGPMVTHLSAAAAPAGTEMDLPVGVLGYSAHLGCTSNDCSSSVITLTKRQPPLDGKAVIHVDHIPYSKSTFATEGTPKGVEANVVAAFKSQGKIEILSTLKRVENGATFFKVDCLFPNGAIVPGQPSGDSGRRVTLGGQLGEHEKISMTYVETESDLAAGSKQEYKGSAAYSEKDKSMHVSFLGADGGKWALDFADPSI